MTQPFGFSTKRYDAQTGLVYHGYRYYSPTIGRWTTRDPLGEAGGLNLYEFVGNNPVNWVDPCGLNPLDRYFRSPVDNLYWKLKRRFPPNVTHNPTPSYVGAEANWIGQGIGITKVTCYDENHHQRIFIYLKDCGTAPALNVSATVGIIRGMDGKNCRPERYEGSFLELGWGLVTADIGLKEKGGFSGVFEGGTAVGVGFNLTHCKYIYIPSLSY